MHDIQRNRPEPSLLEERFQSVAASESNAIIVIAGTGEVLSWNYGAEKIFGFTAAEMIGAPVTRIIPERYRAAHEAGLAKAAATGGGRYVGTNQEVAGLRKDGHEVSISLALSGWKGAAGFQFAAIIRDITASKLREEELRRIAYHDPLTHLPNRLLFSDRLQLAKAQTIRSGRLLAVCYLDLDGFKAVNDAFGHEVGDRLLREAAQRLREAVRAGDTVARLGGDEFGLLLGELAGIEEIEQTLNRILSVIAVPYRIEGHELTLSASIGVTLLPDGDDVPEHLLRQADEAMYLAKAAGRNCFRLFNAEQNRLVHHYRAELERMRGGFERGEFCLRYRPAINVREARVTGFEAILCWQQPDGGMLTPPRIGKDIENSDLAVPTGKWIAGEIMRQSAEWSRAGRDIPVSVNLSARCLQEPGFASWLADSAAVQAGLKPQLLCFEVSEEATLANGPGITALIEKGRPLGIRFAVDAFGAGYSSLSHLRSLAADEIKLAPELVRSLFDRADARDIIRAVVGLGHAFGLTVVADGVAEPEQGALLAQYGCDVVELDEASALPAEAVPAWVAGFDPAVVLADYSLFGVAEADVPLLAARMVHRRWLQSLTAHLADAAATPVESPPGDHRQCALGRWYEGPGQKRYGDLPAFQAIAGSHEAFHRVAAELLARRAAGDAAGASQQLANLTDLSAKIQTSITALLIEMAIASGTR